MSRIAAIRKEFPARAGMNRGLGPRGLAVERVPRARGDELT